jgi:tetratricopeptide (TPR) repeat protein
VLFVVWASLLAGVSLAPADVQALVDDAFAALDRGDAATDDASKLAAYRSAVERAEEAVRLDDSSADAHYALFCSLGRVTERRNPLVQALMLRRVRRELDRVLELDPQRSEALAAKAEMLLRLPRFIGGDLAEAETYVRRALLYDPTYWRAHILLARVLIAEHRPAEARATLAQMLEHIDPHRPEHAEALRMEEAVTSDE